MKNEITALKTSKRDLAADPEKKSLEQIKRKFAAEKEVWAKEKRRLESKVRHLSKQIGTNLSSVKLQFVKTAISVIFLF